jgi:hypothetical protein
MAKTKTYADDDDKLMDSLAHHEDRKAKIRAENKMLEENQEIANFHGLPQAGETRDMLLDRIRKLREPKPEAPPAERYRSPGLQKEYEAEVEAGKAAVARIAKELDYYRTPIQAATAEGEKKVRSDDAGLASEPRHGFPVSR